jgi:hypothetical protein
LESGRLEPIAHGIKEALR